MEPIRVLIVDDEPNVREVLSRKVDWGRYSMQIVGSANNGIEAVEFTQKHEVDLVFMDVRMPFMDGNSAIEAIRKMGKNPAFIVLSAYSDYSYVRASFNLGVEDYLLKNHINTPTMDTLLAKVSRKLSGRTMPSVDIANDVPGAGRDSAHQRYAQGLYFAARVPKRFKMRLDQLLAGLDRELRSTWKYFDDGEYAIMIFPEMKGFGEAESGLPEKFLRKLTAVAAVGCVECTTGHEEAVESAESACRLAFYNETGEIAHAGTSDACTRRLNTDAYKVRLHRSVKLLNLSETRSTFDELFNDIVACRPEPGTAVALVTDVYSFYLDQLYTMDAIPTHIAFGVAEIDRELSGYPRFSYIRDAVTSNLRVVERFFRSSLAQDLPSVLEAYIDSHVGDDLSLEAMSRVFNKSSSYLSAVFSNAHSVSMRKYVTRKRISLAKSYLENFDLRVKDVAELVGFKSTEHFSRTFRHHTGRSPSEFRQSP